MPPSSTLSCRTGLLWSSAISGNAARAVAYHYGDTSEEACVLYASDVTLEDEPTFYLSALSSWLIEHGYVLRARP